MGVFRHLGLSIKNADCGGSRIRTYGTISGTLVFKTSLLNQSPASRQLIYKVLISQNSERTSFVF